MRGRFPVSFSLLSRLSIVVLSSSGGGGAQQALPDKHVPCGGLARGDGGGGAPTAAASSIALLGSTTSTRLPFAAAAPVPASEIVTVALVSAASAKRTGSDGEGVIAIAPPPAPASVPSSRGIGTASRFFVRVGKSSEKKKRQTRRRSSLLLHNPLSSLSLLACGFFSAFERAARLSPPSSHTHASLPSREREIEHREPFRIAPSLCRRRLSSSSFLFLSNQPWRLARPSAPGRWTCTSRCESLRKRSES